MKYAYFVTLKWKGFHNAQDIHYKEFSNTTFKVEDCFKYSNVDGQPYQIIFVEKVVKIPRGNSELHLVKTTAFCNEICYLLVIDEVIAVNLV